MFVNGAKNPITIEQKKFLKYLLDSRTDSMGENEKLVASTVYDNGYYAFKGTRLTLNILHTTFHNDYLHYQKLLKQKSDTI